MGRRGQCRYDNIPRARSGSVESDSAAAACDTVTGAEECIVGELVSGGEMVWEVISMVVVTKMLEKGCHGTHNVAIRINGHFENNQGGATRLRWKIAAEGALGTPRRTITQQ